MVFIPIGHASRAQKNKTVIAKHPQLSRSTSSHNRRRYCRPIIVGRPSSFGYPSASERCIPFGKYTRFAKRLSLHLHGREQPAAQHHSRPRSDLKLNKQMPSVWIGRLKSSSSTKKHAKPPSRQNGSSTNNQRPRSPTRPHKKLVSSLRIGQYYG